MSQRERRRRRILRWLGSQGFISTCGRAIPGTPVVRGARREINLRAPTLLNPCLYVQNVIVRTRADKKLKERDVTQGKGRIYFETVEEAVFYCCCCGVCSLILVCI